MYYSELNQSLLNYVYLYTTFVDHVWSTGGVCYELYHYDVIINFWIS